MIRSIFLGVFFCLGLAGCSGSTVSSANSVATNSNKVSFGLYDLNTSPSAAANATNATVPADQVALRMTGGGGGGGARTEQSYVAQMVTLAQSAAAAVDTSATDRKIIRNADLDLESDNPEDAQRKITSLAELRGGFVVESQQSSSDVQSTTRDIVTMTVRVPADKFADTLADIRNVASRVVTETIKGQDVTEEFIDIEAQIKTKKALEQQFMEIMRRANTVEDALDVQNQLAEVRGEIERIEGRKRFLENQSAMSTIKIRLQTPKVFATASVGFGSRLSDSFIAGIDVAMNFVLGLITFVIASLPFALFIGLPAFVFFRYVWKRQSTPRSVVELAEDELKIT